MEPSLLRNLFAVCRTHWKRLFIASLLVLISNLLLVVNPLIFRQAVMAMDPSSTHQVWIPWKEYLTPWVVILLSISLLSSFLKYEMRMSFISVSRDVEANVRSLLYDRIQSQSASFFDRHRIGSLMSRLTNDINAYREVLGPGIMYPMFFITLVVPALLALYWISFYLALLSTLPMVLLPLLIALIRNTTYRTSFKIQKILGKLSAAAHEHFTGIRIVKAYCAEESAKEEFSKECQEFIHLNLWLSGIKGIFFPFLTLLTKITTILLVMLSGYIVVKAWADLQPADFVSFMWIQSFIFIPVLMLGWVLPIYIQGSAAYQRLVEIYQEPVEVQDLLATKTNIPEHATIECKGLTFSYPGSSIPSLKDLHFTIDPGSFIGITGPVGSGKTTLFRMITRDYEIPEGMVFIGGEDIHQYSLEAIQKAIIAVEQTPFLFSATIEENLQLAKSSLESTIVESAVENLDHFDYAVETADLLTTIQEFPEQYQTKIGERGVTLSGGQKQRLTLARALIVDRQIYLFDDIFSAVDYTTERRIFEHIKTGLKGKTVFMITHRVSILNEMDRIFYFMDGAIVERGSPQELERLKGHYAALVELQKLNV